jgi:hypothetical protein
MSSPFESALRQFDRTEANLVKLEKLWDRIKGLIPSPGTHVFSEQPDYDQLCLTFRGILAAVPAIDGWKLPDALPSMNDAISNCIDASEVGDVDALLSTDDYLHKQGEHLREYRLRFNVKRRELTRTALMQSAVAIDNDLLQIEATLAGRRPEDKLSGPAVDDLAQHIREIATLIGSDRRLPRWDDLQRHLSFGQVHDFFDIRDHDWPAIRPALDVALCGEGDPLPVEVSDLSKLTGVQSDGPIATRLQWDRLTDEDFERLVFNLIRDCHGYENPQWLTRTHAPDRGRDLSVMRIQKDALAETRVLRVIIQCKHWLDKSVDVPAVTQTMNLVHTWEPPRVDVVVIATSGRFTGDAITVIEKHNEADHACRYEMWPESRLEHLLAERPALVAEFNLR